MRRTLVFVSVAATVLAAAAADRSAELAARIRAAKPGDTVVIPAGVYHLDRPVQVVGCTNVVVRGEAGTVFELKFDPCGPLNGNADGFAVSDSAHLRFERLHFTTDLPTSFSGRVTAVDDAAGTYDVELESEFEGLFTGKEHFVAANTCDEEGSPYGESGGTRYEKTGPRTLRANLPKGSDRPDFRTGCRIVYRCEIYGNRVMRFVDCHDVTLSDIWIERCASMGVGVSAASVDFTVDRLRIGVAPGSRSIYAANADGVHVLGLSGSFKMLNCSFCGLGDDALNVHDMIADYKGVEAATGRPYLSCRGYSQKEEPIRHRWADPGDKLTVYDRKTLKKKGELIFEAFSADRMRGYVKTDGSGAAAGDYVANANHLPEVLVKDCTFRNTRARGIVLRSRHMRVENCLFRGLAIAGILLAVDFGRWRESAPVEDVEIRDCTFEKCTLSGPGRDRGAVMVRTDCFSFNGPPGVHRDVRIVNNSFADCLDSVVAATSVEGLLIASNRVCNCAGGKTDERCFRLNACTDVTVKDNAYAVRPPAFSQAGYWPVAGSPRRVSSLNADWTFSLDDFKTSKRVSLPHSIDEGEIGFEASGGVNRQQPAHYRKTFSWPGGSARQFLHFEAIMGKSRVTLNGKVVAEHFGGFLPIHVEVTGVLRPGENELAVWCDNSDDPSYPPGKPQKYLDFTYFGGIYRDAWLVETGRAYVADSDRGGVYVTSHLETNGLWTVTADVTLGGEAEGTTTRLYYDGCPVVSPFALREPKVWSPDSPNLHLLEVRVLRGDRIEDAVGVRFGIRDFRLDGQGLTLNGKPYPRKLIGVNRHQDYLFIGMALPNSLHWRDVKKYKDAGLEVFRSAHYPQDPAFMDACDELGMFVIDCTPGWQFWNDRDPNFERRVYDDIVKMVRRDRSRPSLLMWEPILNETRFPAAFATNALAAVKRETRAPSYSACDFESRGSAAFDLTYGRANGPDKACFCREWGDFPDDWHAQNSSSRVAMEWGESPMVAQALHYLYEQRWPSLREQRAKPPCHFGGTLWHGADHSRGYHPDNFFGGILTYGRQKKYSYYAFRAALTREPFVFVAHELAPYSPAEMHVFSNCAYKAEFLGKPFVPGETKFDYSALQKLSYSWNNPQNWAKANLRVTLPDGRVQVHERAKRFARLKLALDTEGLPPVADGSDLVACTATLVDAADTPKRHLTEKVRFSVEGPAELVGENPQQTRWGEAIVLVRPKAVGRPEPITVRAELVRTGLHVPQGGRLTFTPGVAETHAAGVSDERKSGLEEVERQQRDFNVKDS